jgi:hypothetical protein
MMARAMTAYEGVLADLGRLRLAAACGAATGLRDVGWRLVHSLLECLALANQRTCEAGMGKTIHDLHWLPAKPDRLEISIERILTGPRPSEVIEEAETVVLAVRDLLRSFQSALPAPRTPRERFGGAYPEMRDMMRKLLLACERKDRILASLSAWHLQRDLMGMLCEAPAYVRITDAGDRTVSGYRKAGLPDLLSFCDGPLDELARQTRLLDSALRAWVRGQSLDLSEFDAFDAWKHSGDSPAQDTPSP